MPGGARDHCNTLYAASDILEHHQHQLCLVDNITEAAQIHKMKSGQCFMALHELQC